MKKDIQKITKFKGYIDLEKEIQYINYMNHKGWKLVYIKFGVFYTFIKVKPDEYVTIMYATTKETVSSLSAMIAQFGYENIPHTFDGLGSFLYLTGKKSEVSESFISDNESKKKLFKKYLSLYSITFIINLIISVIFSIMFAIPVKPFLYILSNIDRYPSNKIIDLKMSAVIILTMGILSVIFITTAVRFLYLIIRYKKRYRLLCNDMKVFE